MRKFIKKMVQKINEVTAALTVKALSLEKNCKKALSNEHGMETVEVVVIVIIAIVVLTVIFFPKLSEIVTSALDNADTKIDDIWNYKG